MKAFSLHKKMKLLFSLTPWISFLSEIFKKFKCDNNFQMQCFKCQVNVFREQKDSNTQCESHVTSASTKAHRAL